MNHNKRAKSTKSYQLAKYLSQALLVLQCAFIVLVLLGYAFGIVEVASFDPSSFLPLLASMLLSFVALASLRRLNKKGLIMLGIAYGILIVTGFLYMGMIFASLYGFWPLAFMLPHFWVLFLGFICVPAVILLFWVNAWIVVSANKER